MAMEDFLPHLTHMTGRQRRTSVHFYEAGEVPPRVPTKESLAENQDDTHLLLEDCVDCVDLEMPGEHQQG